ncbi:MAG TPA: pitrilysin family protein [Leptospiraceae bacterium]|nr:pitrilysin family protein [Leptospiraceae bacterium]HMW03588.1 pitrilysin family protein [Leptospiraceae bacterium]HMX32329.1 pitrilysin family protein [Leptospiraceae bacterium]HMY29491.1 pitrilysin family protein [Leptospiraceae bacterium]HMZ63588.1 pitrilysin family protein [Leptospiraceae bacterium]
MKSIISVFLGILLLFTQTVSAENIFEDVANRLKKSIKKVEFENGLRLIMMQNNTSPTLALYAKFKVGSVDETKEIAGTAHLLEHMLFKGTENVGTTNYAEEKKYHILLKATGSELDKLRLEKKNFEDQEKSIPKELLERIKRLERRLKDVEEIQKKFIIKSEDTYIYEQHGQVGFNAYTSHDVTNYQIRLPANRLEIWAKMESDRLKNPILREYYTERDVIMEERRMRVENRGIGLLRERFLELAFGEHAYGQPVIGYESNIPFLDIYETENFFKKYYTPDNMVIAIVGDLDFDKTEAMIKKYFSDLKPSSEKKLGTRVREKMNTGEKRISFAYPGGSILVMGWHKPAYPNRDSSVLDLVDAILTQGTSSRLYRRLALKERLVTSVDAYASDPGDRYSNLFSIYTQLNSDADPNKVESIIWEEIEKLKKEPVSKEELQRIKNKMTADFLRDIDNNGSLADNLSYYELLTGTWEDLFLSYDKLNNITEEDIQKVVSKYFVKENLTVGHLDSRNYMAPAKSTQTGKNTK